MPGTCVIAPPAALPSKAAWAVGNPAPLSGTGVVGGVLSLSARPDRKFERVAA